MKIRLLSILTAVLFPIFLFAQDIPTADEVRKVLDFYNNGQGQGIVLRDSKICAGIHKDGVSKYECKDEIIEFVQGDDASIPPEVKHKISVDETIWLWMSFMVPQGDKSKVIIQYSMGGTARHSSKANVKGSIRYRTWTKYTPKTPGTWEITIFHDLGENTRELNSFELIVEP